MIIFTQNDLKVKKRKRWVDLIKHTGLYNPLKTIGRE